MVKLDAKIAIATFDQNRTIKIKKKMKKNADRTVKLGDFHCTEG